MKILKTMRDVSICFMIAAILGLVASVTYDGMASKNNVIWVITIVVFTVVSFGVGYIINERRKAQNRRELMKKKKMFILPSIEEQR